MSKIDPQDIVGRAFTHLVVLEYAGRQGDRHFYLCQCSCGSVRKYGRSNLRSGGTKSCGCKTAEMLVAKRTKHGMNESPTYKVWESMLARCRNKGAREYQNYGARGIAVCERWLKFENFIADMGEAPTKMQIDRIDNDGNYSPENCRWVSAKENSRNKRTNVLITWKGEARCISEWAEITGMCDETIRYRFHRGWPAEKIFSPQFAGRKSGTPLRKSRKSGQSNHGYGVANENDHRR